MQRLFAESIALWGKNRSCRSTQLSCQSRPQAPPKSAIAKTPQVASPFPTARPFRLRPSLHLPTPKAKPTRSEAPALVGTQVRRLRQAAGL